MPCSEGRGPVGLPCRLPPPWGRSSGLADSPILQARVILRRRPGRRTGLLADAYAVKLLHTSGVARKHYLQVPAEHFRKATQNGLQNRVKNPSEPDRMASSEREAGLGELAFSEPIQNNATPCKSKGLHHMTPRGLEPRLPG